MLFKFGFIDKLRFRNRRGRRVQGERVEDIVLRLACIRELRSQADGNLLLCHACEITRTGFETKEEIRRMRENIKRAESICDFLQKKEMQEKRKLRYTAPLFTIHYQDDYDKYMSQYNIAYNEDYEVYYPIPRFLDSRDEELQLEHGTYDNVNAAATALIRRNAEKVRFHVFHGEEE